MKVYVVLYQDYLTHISGSQDYTISSIYKKVCDATAQVEAIKNAGGDAKIEEFSIV